MERPLILVSNDDGYFAEGVRALATGLAPLGEVVVVAPLTNQSAMSHAMTFSRPLRLQEQHPIETEHGNILVHSVDGTPTDCIYMAAHHLFKGQKIHLVASGINHGANLGNDVFYSGTVSAAMEGSFLNIPSIAFSLVANHSFDFSSAAIFAKAICQKILQKPLDLGVILNVNIPKKVTKEGFWATTLGEHAYTAKVQERKDPNGHPYYWIGGPWYGFENKEGTDCHAIAQGAISVTPVALNLTSHKHLEYLKHDC